MELNKREVPTLLYLPKELREFIAQLAIIRLESASDTIAHVISVYRKHCAQIERLEIKH